jgi:hypothetical protein
MLAVPPTTRTPTHCGLQGDHTTLPRPYGVPRGAQRVHEAQRQGGRWLRSGACAAACAHGDTKLQRSHLRGRQPGDGTVPLRPRGSRTGAQRVPEAFCIWALCGRSAACAAGAYSASSSGLHPQQPVAAAHPPDPLPARPYTRTHARTHAGCR